MSKFKLGKVKDGLGRIGEIIQLDSTTHHNFPIRAIFMHENGFREENVFTEQGRFHLNSENPRDIIPNAKPEKEFISYEEKDVHFMDELYEELKAARQWPTYNSAHEGFAILLEEMDELKTHVWTNQKKRDLKAMQKEALQVAAVALRFAMDVCNEEIGRK